MKLRVKEICKEKGIMLRDVAEQIGITEVGLSKSLNGNPTVERLQSIAKVLDVKFSELFESDGITGFIKSDGIVHEVKSVADIKNLLNKLEKNNQLKQTEL